MTVWFHSFFPFISVFGRSLHIIFVQCCRIAFVIVSRTKMKSGFNSNESPFKHRKHRKYWIICRNWNFTTKRKYSESIVWNAHFTPDTYNVSRLISILIWFDFFYCYFISFMSWVLDRFGFSLWSTIMSNTRPWAICEHHLSIIKFTLFTHTQQEWTKFPLNNIRIDEPTIR